MEVILKWIMYFMQNNSFIKCFACGVEHLWVNPILPETHWNLYIGIWLNIIWNH